MGLARRGRGAEAVRRRVRSVLRRSASRNRHRGAGRVAGALTRDGNRLLRRSAPARREVPHDPHRRRLLGHARSRRIDRRSGRDRDRRGRGRRHDRPERRARGAGPVRAPRRSSDRRSQRLPRSAVAAPRPAGSRSPAASRVDAAAARAGRGPGCAAREALGGGRRPPARGGAYEACRGAFNTPRAREHGGADGVDAAPGPGSDAAAGDACFVAAPLAARVGRAACHRGGVATSAGRACGDRGPAAERGGTTAPVQTRCAGGGRASGPRGATRKGRKRRCQGSRARGSRRRRSRAHRALGSLAEETAGGPGAGPIRGATAP